MTGTELRAIRSALGLTQSQFAVELGLESKNALRTISNWEADRHPISGTAAKLATLLLRERAA